ncbi:hypothetical protein ACFYOA_02400 [Streptomyces iakyrus]|uniref:hypothetical protein n=1 Tax=Streptomyces iakyrus TaxID=68219 RepID=UPI0036BA39B0
MFLDREAVRASRLFVHPPLSIREVRCGARGLVRKSVPLFTLHVYDGGQHLLDAQLPGLPLPRP